VKTQPDGRSARDPRSAGRAEHAGIAILHVLMLLTVLMAIAEGAALVARVEVRVSHFHRSEREASYAAQAMLAASIQELERTSDWTAVLSGAQVASFVDGPADLPRQIPGGSTVNVCCGAGSLTGRLRGETGDGWQVFGWQSAGGLLNVADAPKQYIVAWVLDDRDETDGNPLADTNDRIAVHVESVSTLGVRKALEALVGRAPLDMATGSRLPGLELLVWRAVH
jgi:Tfp pilus assembly protein PilX